MRKLRQDICIGDNLRKLRKRCGLTQEQVSARLQIFGCNTTRSVYSRYETGELNIRISDMVALKKIFRCSYDDFFKGLD